MEDKVEIEIGLKFKEFKFEFEKSKKVATIKQNKLLKEKILQKLNLKNDDVNMSFEFCPQFNPNEIIADWIKRDPNASVKLSLNSRESNNLESYGCSFGILNVIENSFLDETKKLISDALNKQDEKNEIRINELKEMVQVMSSKIDNLNAEKEIHPLLDFVARFRKKILSQLFNDKIIPEKSDNWLDIYNFLGEKYGPRERQNKIDDAVEKLGLKYEDWSNLKYINNKFNNFKNPDPRLSKDKAYEKIENLRGTEFWNLYEPFKNLVDLFEKNNW